ncbi:MAG: glycosyl transferase family 2, partial [Dokdonella sp.]
LHADSILTPDCAAALARHISRNWNVLGYFDLRFLADGPPLMGINSFGAWWRSRLFGLPFGDQGFVLSRRLLDELHGFDTTVTSGEDHDFIWRARAAGAKLRAVGASLHTSARKYALNGWRRTTGQHLRETWRQARLFSRRAT